VPKRRTTESFVNLPDYASCWAELYDDDPAEMQDPELVETR
jgi:hypothetical protein